MSETVQIVLIVSVVILIVLWIFRSSLQSFILRIRDGSFETELQTREQQEAKKSNGVSVSRNKLFGKNKIDVDAQNTSVDENLAVGENEIKVKQPKSKKRKK